MTSYTAQGFLNLAVGARTILPAYSRAIGKNYLGSLATSGGVPNTPDGTDDVATVVFLVNLSLGLLFYGFSIYCLLVSATMSLSVYIGSFTGRYEFCPSSASLKQKCNHFELMQLQCPACFLLHSRQQAS